MLDEYTIQMGFAEHTLLALLAVRIPALGAGGRLAQALAALSAWAFNADGTVVPCAHGLLHFKEATDVLCAVLSTYRWVTFAAIMLHLQLCLNLQPQVLQVWHLE